VTLHLLDEFALPIEVESSRPTSPDPSLLIPTTWQHWTDLMDEMDAKCLVSGLADTGRHQKNAEK